LHGAMHEEGESPWLLGTLVRTYAHLGILTEYDWYASSRAFRARSLLYAQRLVAQKPCSPWGLWHRAYAEALAGMHALALQDLTAAEKLPKSNLSGPPSWVELIATYSRFETNKLNVVAERGGDLAGLARLLAYLAVEDNSSMYQTLHAAQALLENNPECYRVHDGRCAVGGLANLHEATLASGKVFSQTLSQRLADIPGLPPAVDAALKGQQGEVAILRALAEAAGPGKGVDEPSWGMLARMLREVRFKQVNSRLSFMRYHWSVPTEEFLQESLPLISDHPYLPYLKGYGLDYRSQTADFLALLESQRLLDLDIRQDALVFAFQIVQSPKTVPLLILAANHMDYTHPDMALSLSRVVERDRQRYARWLYEISPHSPLARAGLIQFDWPSVAKQAEQWEKAPGATAAVFRALGNRYAELGRPQDAIRCLQRAMSASPDKTAYEALAHVYKAQGDMVRWQAILDEYLTQESFGLDHAQVQVEIARYFMSLKHWKKAQPYADAAAETWAEWAMRCASECHQGLGNWVKSEELIRQVAERYPMARFDWAYWCARTGRGNLMQAQSARALNDADGQEDGGGPVPRGEVQHGRSGSHGGR
jgi:tetratricopeptide (TPR) repeat protein